MINKKNRKYLLKGIIDMLPFNLAVLPWGILCGSLAIQRGMSELEAILMPLLVFAGAVQLVSIELIAGNASIASILITTFIISSRHFLYGLSLRNKVQNLNSKQRYLIGFLLTDELFALSSSKKAFQHHQRFIYGLAAGGSFYFFWLVWNVLGVYAGSVLPNLTNLGLDFAIAVTFIALVIPSIKSMATLTAVVVSALLSVLMTLHELPFVLVGASLCAMLAGFIVCRKSNRIVEGRGK